MRKLAAAAAAALLMPGSLAAGPEDWGAAAEGRHRIGYGLIFTNDELGDGHDRWRTGGLASSRIYGYGWDGAAPAEFGSLLELRLQGQIIAPENLRNPGAGDRPWAGSLSAELYTHMQRGGAELSVGGGLTATGPQTHLDDFQDGLHDLLGAPQPSAALLAAQVPNKIRPVAAAEAAHSYDIGSGAVLRPFAEARAGDETLVRIGADIMFGPAGRGELLIREPVSGQRYRAVTSGGAPGVSFTLGADIAHVADSIYLPEGRGYQLETSRSRLRAGLHWQGQGIAAFYGLTYLSKEFDRQREGQFTGALQVKLRF